MFNESLSHSCCFPHIQLLSDSNSSHLTTWQVVVFSSLIKFEHRTFNLFKYIVRLLFFKKKRENRRPPAIFYAKYKTDPIITHLNLSESIANLISLTNAYRLLLIQIDQIWSKFNEIRKFKNPEILQIIA